MSSDFFEALQREASQKDLLNDQEKEAQRHMEMNWFKTAGSGGALDKIKPSEHTEAAHPSKAEGEVENLQYHPSSDALSKIKPSQHTEDADYKDQGEKEKLLYPTAAMTAEERQRLAADIAKIADPVEREKRAKALEAAPGTAVTAGEKCKECEMAECECEEKRPSKASLNMQAAPHNQKDPGAGHTEAVDKRHKDQGQDGGTKPNPTTDALDRIKPSEHTEKAHDAKDEGQREKLELNPGMKWTAPNVPHNLHTEDGAKGHKDLGDSGHTKPNPRPGAFEPSLHQHTEKGLGEKFKDAGEMAGKLHKQFSQNGLNFLKQAADDAAMSNEDVTVHDALECIEYDLAVVAEQNKNNKEVLKLIGKAMGLVDTIELMLNPEAEATEIMEHHPEVVHEHPHKLAAVAPGVVKSPMDAPTEAKKKPCPKHKEHNSTCAECK